MYRFHTTRNYLSALENEFRNTKTWEEGNKYVNQKNFYFLYFRAKKSYIFSR